MLTLNINQYTFWQQKPAFVLDADIENFWVMYVIETGQCSYQIGPKKGQAQPATILLCPPHVKFSRKVLQPLTFHFFRFSFQSDLFMQQELTGNFTQANPRILEDCDHLKKLEYRLSPTAKSLRNHLLTDIFYTELFRRLFEDKIPIVTSLPIQNALHFMDEHYHEGICVGDVAQYIGWSAGYFSRQFKKVTQLNAIQYLDRIRLRAVQQLLISTDLPISNIAEQTGFTDGYYLSKKFSQYMKTSPTKFRKTHQI
ncbi:helix-turn-helix domain-containing protein [Loigolactobacillus jiayinensis]|uniref:Helix-turn-helix domain-containing protein n=1 Tax=Loigolactobacillus jiayinensis TaxID=2486016 RepID=A0ABW1RFA0_9LACO|nr:AraC family transcriptional regulator [Loigolactobacillus jiayinensis]